MKAEKAKFTWHYYVMATGALGAMLAGTLGSTGGVVSGLALAVVSHGALPFKTMTRLFFQLAFVGLYVFSFPDPDVVREMMANQHVPMTSETAEMMAAPSDSVPEANPANVSDAINTDIAPVTVDSVVEPVIEAVVDTKQ